jgi:carboxyl-terminal processing protease
MKSFRIKLRIFTLLVLLARLLGLAACGEKPAHTPEEQIATPTAPATNSSAEEGYVDCFETVWRTVNETYFDPSFGSLDWKEVHSRYQPLIAAAEDDQEFYRLVNDMLWELNVSHAAVSPPGGLARRLPGAFAEGGIGIDVRLLDGEAVITSVEPGSPGDEAGLRPGLAIERIDGTPIEQIVEEAESHMTPPYNSRGHLETVTRVILGYVYGPPDVAVSIAYLDGGGEAQETKILRTRRDRKTSPSWGLPPFFLEFESMRLEDGIGYIRFNTFHPDLTKDIRNAIETMGDAPGLIIDLRGNMGGTGFELAEQLLTERALFVKLHTRDGATDVVLDPADNAYEGPVVLLIDVTCYSNCELHAAGLQATGRAVIVGERSPGSVTAANATKLPNGATFLYPIVQISTPDGTVLEGHGVVPDIEVKLDRRLLLEGIDSQLAAAIKHIEQEMQR